MCTDALFPGPAQLSIACCTEKWQVMESWVWPGNEAILVTKV